MARDHSQEPMTDLEIEAVRDTLFAQRKEIREYLANQDINVSSDRDHAEGDGSKD